MRKAFGSRMLGMKIKSVALAIAIVGFFAIAPSIQAQDRVLNDQTTPPIPGVGHDYIKEFSEIVDPGTGALSLRLTVPLPPGRKLSLPFAFSYDTGGIFVDFPSPTWTVSKNYLYTAGWAYSLPSLTINQLQFPVYGSNGKQIGTCDTYTGMTFTDPTSGRNGLGVSTSTCASVQPVNYSPGEFFASSLTIPSTVSVARRDGTVYNFGWQECGPPGSVPENPAGGVALPISIEDSNGNRIAFTPLPSNCNGSFTATDTAGRAVITSSGFGVSGNTLAVSGYSNPYSLTWGTANADITLKGTLVPGGGDNECSATYINPYSGSIPFVTAISLPNGQSYSFTPDPTYGLVKMIKYPSGGTVTYTWSVQAGYEFGVYPDQTGLANACDYAIDALVVSKRVVTYDGTTPAEEQDFQYTQTLGTGSWATRTTTVTTKDLIAGSSFNTVYYYMPYGITPNGPWMSGTYNLAYSLLPLERTITYGDTNGNTLDTVTKGWYDPNLLGCELHSLSTGISGTFYAYQNSGGQAFGAQLVDKKEYDYGAITSTSVCPIAPLLGSPPSPSATPTRETVTTYQTITTPIFTAGPSIFDRPASVAVKGNGTLAAQTSYSYDQSAVVSASATEHDETNYGPSVSAGRGNPTTITQQCFPSCTNAVTTFAYDETGQVLSATDPCGNGTCSDMGGTSHTTTYSYKDSYTIGTAPGNTNAFVTQIKRPTATNGVSHISNYSYAYLDSQLTVAKDENSQPTSYTYADRLDRLTAVNYPDTGGTTYAYNDTPPSPTVTTSTLITSGLSLTTITTLDGMGHHVGTALTTDPQGTDYTASTYDGLGNVRTVHNPYRSTSDPTYGITTYNHDAFGRTTLVTEPDGSTVSTVYSGNTATITDEAGRNRETFTNGLGYMTEVIENPGGLGYITNYTNDALGDLTSVVQGGSRARSFVYDSLKRLTSSSNPESGSVRYTYDLNSNVVTKTDARAITITYSWDALNRLSKRTYSNGDPYAGFGYDSTTCVVVSACYNIGQMTSMTDAAGTESWAYDKMGRMWGDQRTTNSITKNTGYTYNLDGSLNTLNYPTGHTVAFTVGGAGLPLTAADSAIPTSYVETATYTPWGVLNFALMAAGISEQLTYNTRLQPSSTSTTKTIVCPPSGCNLAVDPLTTETTTFMNLTYNFNLGADNGNLIGITNGLNSNRSQVYGYDAVNRIKSAGTLSTCTANCWGLTFGLDEWANLKTATATGTAIPFTLTVNTNNQIATANSLPFTYDASGNELTDVTSTYAWNAESEMKTGGGVTYLYDGRGNRVEKVGNELYWYGPSDEVLDETDATGSSANATFSEYIYFAGARVARRDYLNDIYLYLEDQVNSSRVIVEIPEGSNTAGRCYDADYYPYGGEIDFTTNTCPQNYKYDAKERDAETGNDYFGARFYSSTYGHFLSPDPMGNYFANGANPQSWNLYSFVRNSPLSYSDPTGLDCIYMNTAGPGVDRVVVGDCDSDTDDGYFVDGHVIGGKRGVSVSDDNNVIVYSWEPDDHSFKGIESRCTGDCSSYTVNVSAQPPPNGGTYMERPPNKLTTMSAYIPWGTIVTSPWVGPKWEHVLYKAGCTNNAAMTSDSSPRGSTDVPEGSNQQTARTSGGGPALNSQGRGSSETFNNFTGATEATNTTLNCIATTP